MSIIEIMIAMMILAILCSAIMGLSASVKQKVQERLDEEAIMDAVKEEDDVFVEDVLTEDPIEGEEYTEVPAPDYNDPVNHDSAPTMGSVLLNIVLVAIIVGVAMHKLIGKWLQKDYDATIQSIKDAQQQPTESTVKIYYDSNYGIATFILHLEHALKDKFNARDKEYFNKIRICAQVFDSLDRSKLTTMSRIEDVYIPAVVSIVEEIEKAPSKTIAANLMPYFHRACDVLREAMEAELKTYQDRAVMSVESNLKAVERFSALKNDTDDNAGVGLTL